jgi:hypothetical protein
MFMMGWIEPIPFLRRLGVSLLLIALMSGCVTTGDGLPVLSGAAEQRIRSSEALLRQLPACAIVMPSIGAVPPGGAGMIERVVARHFAQRLPRLIGSPERRALARAGAYNLSDPIDRGRFARMLSCRHGLEITVHAAGISYVVAWAGRHVDLTLTLFRFNDEEVLWSARHGLDRSAGGLPTGPLSLVLDTVRASVFASDRDGTEALVEDVVRQVAQTFPDLRQIQ